MSMTRVHVPMTDDTRAHLQSLADASGTSLAAACRDLLAEVAPAAAEMAKAIRTAKTAPSRALRDVALYLDAQIAQVDQLKLELSPKATGRKKKAG